MVDKLPLDSPLWNQLSAAFSAENALARLREIVATRQLGEAWQSLCDEILHQGSVYGVSSAAIPYLVDVAPYLPARSKRDLWIEIGFLVTSGADRFPAPPAPGLQEGLTAALRTAETLAVQDFLADADLPPGDSSYYALACIALAGHPVGRAMWQFPSAGNGYVDLACPGCGAEHEVDGFADPLSPPCPAPAFAPMPDAAAPGTGVSAWRDVAAAVDRSGRNQVLGAGWADFFDTARQVAAVGVPQRASSSAVWCLVAAMVATSSDAAASWARTLTRLAGHVRCVDCDEVWAIADVMNSGDDAEPVEVSGELGSPSPFVQSALFRADDDPGAGQRLRGSVPADTIADGIAGFRPSPSRELRREQLALRTLWRADGGAVDCLTRMACEPAVVVAAGRDGVALRDPAPGALAGPPLACLATAVASLTLPDGGAVIAAAGGDGGGVRWWDGLTGRLLDGAATDGSATDGSATDGSAPASLTPVRMPASPNPRTAEWLAGLWDGRVMLAAGDADGVIRLWDPVARAPLAGIAQRAGQPVTSMAAVEFTELVAVHGNLIVDVWSSAAVHGNARELAAARKLAAVGHRHIVGVAVSPEHRGRRKPVLLADRDGLVSRWETFGVRLSDPLPPDPAHREVVGITALPTADAGIAVATASRADRNLRIWEPQGGVTALIPLDVRPRCLLNVGDVLFIGHDDGLLALTLVSGFGKVA